MKFFNFCRGESNWCDIKIEIHRQLDFGDAGLVEVVLDRFRVTTRQAFGMMVRLPRVQGLGVGIEEARQQFQLQRMEMPAVRMRLHLAVMRVSVIGMVMLGYSETEMKRPQQDKGKSQRRTKF